LPFAGAIVFGGGRKGGIRFRGNCAACHSELQRNECEQDDSHDIRTGRW
jgi:mono/diheme cytochrome c family protein